LKTSIIDNIKSLPPLSKTISEIERIYSDENSSINEMAKVIEKDPMIVANLLKAANSALYSFGREIKSAFQAVSLFGMSTTRSIALSNAVRKLLNIDMQPYGITSDEFAEISSKQAVLMFKWYGSIDRKKADKLYLATFLQETGKYLIASEIIQEDEVISFKSEVETSYNLAMLEKSYVGVSSAEVTAEIFEHWKFDNEFVEMIRYSDNPKEAPDEVREFSTILNIIKTIVSVNHPFSEQSINFGLKKAENEAYDVELLVDAIDTIKDKLSLNE